ncbi:MAG TPA: helix-turn-helix transcriptional regulator [Acidimicrobiia bacterium]|nr:helix-turn-helix transcriptional regulator [Acidimicrobiia bacterium]
MTGGLLIREARKRAQLTQTELATRLNSHQSVVARWETGGTNPDFDTVRNAVRAAGYELDVSLHPTDEHDLALIRRELRLLPYERLSSMVEAVRIFTAMSDAARG